MKSGFVAILGETNSGKSTLVNAVLNRKISITAPKHQTTRNTIKGILTEGDTQIVFLDTPGFTNQKHALAGFMNREIRSAIKDAELKILLVDCNKDFSLSVKRLKTLAPKIKDVFLVVNKMDILKDEKHLFEEVIKATSIIEFSDVFYISAKTKRQLELLLKGLRENLPSPFFYYPVDQEVDYNQKFFLEEVVREKCFIFLDKEIPYYLYVECSSYDETDKKITADLKIVTLKESHKGIIIGSGAKTLKTITKSSEEELKKSLQKNVKLTLSVFVKSEKTFNNFVTSRGR